MRTAIYSIISFMFVIGSVWAVDQFSGSDSVHSGGEDEGHEGGEGEGHEVELSDMDIIVFCNSHKSGRIKAAREYGAKLFGSKEAFFKNYHRIQCPPYYPSPLYHSIEQQIFERELVKELDYIEKFLTKEERQRLLNRPDKGRRKVTILGLADISHKIATRGGNQAAAQKYDLIREKLEKMGAKRSEELTPDELAQYE